MTREEKQLLLKDLCARLPYGVYGQFDVPSEKSKFERVLVVGDMCGIFSGVCLFKPYLRPLSTMTEEEENEWNELNIDPLLEAAVEQHTKIEDLMLRAKSQYEPLEWLNAHHFDYRGLIEKSLALVAPEGMYRYEISSSKKDS